MSNLYNLSHFDDICMLILCLFLQNPTWEVLETRKINYETLWYAHLFGWVEYGYSDYWIVWFPGDHDYSVIHHWMVTGSGFCNAHQAIVPCAIVPSKIARVKSSKFKAMLVEAALSSNMAHPPSFPPLRVSWFSAHHASNSAYPVE